MKSRRSPLVIRCQRQKTKLTIWESKWEKHLQNSPESKPKTQSWAKVKEMKDLAILRAPSIAHHEPFLYCTTQIACLLCSASANYTRSAIYPRHLSPLTACGQGSFHNLRLLGIAWLSVTPQNETVWSKRERVNRKCAYAAEPEANCPDLDTQQLGYLYSFTHSCLYGDVLHVFVGVCSSWWVCVNIYGNLCFAIFTKTLRGVVQQILIQLKWLKIKYSNYIYHKKEYITILICCLYIKKYINCYIFKYYIPHYITNTMC